MRNLGIFLLVGITFAGCATDDGVDVSEVASESQVLVAEVEPNAVIANATPIVGTEAVMIGNNFPGSDVDLYSFSGTLGDRVYATTMTSIGQGSTDSTITLLRADGTTVVETDVSDGTFAASAGAIAGALLPATETYYIRVTQAATSTIRPYHLHFQLRSGTPEVEAEPNDAAPQALTTGWVAGSLLLATDVDLYSVTVNAGDTIYASLDNDPERDGVEFNGTLGIGPFGGSVLVVNDAGATGPDAEAHFVTVKDAGTYVIRVAASGALFSTYELNVTVHPAAPTASCTTYTSTNVPQTIPTGPGAAPPSTLVISDDVRIEDLDVHLNMTHDFMSDVAVHLTTPDGNTIAIESNAGATVFGSTTMNVTVDDEAAIPINAFTIVTGMKSLPNVAYRLHWLDGQRAMGTWTLQVYDEFSPDGGTLNSWGLTICPTAPAPTCPLGTTPQTLYSSDFEADDGSFTHAGTQDEWERGLPTFGAITTCNSGTNCWKTDLDNTYNASSNFDLVSPPILLAANVVGPIRVQWAQKYQFESASFDHASVDVRLVNDSNPTRLFEFRDGTMTDVVPGSTVQMAAGWAVRTADVTSYSGQQIELAFHVDSDGSGQFAGFAVDDVIVTGCRLPSVCGNGIPEPGEVCDDGGTANGDGCSADCLSDETCGNGYIDSGLPTNPEVCDDDNNIDGDGCSANCLSDETCGNDVTDTSVGEVCDDGGTSSGDGCSDDCLSDETCGNTYTDVDIGEQCDDGNTVGDDGCSADCFSDETCGNDVLDDTITPTPEVCDDGNTGGGDGCSGDCLSDESCGNGIIDTAAGEVCDDSNTTPSDGCSADCRSDETCGNGVTDTTEGEQCDDGNTTGLDGCSADCLSNETCPNGVVDPGEDCDDGNTTPGDGCTVACAFEICGNGIQDPGEECDDGNTTSGDGCNATCTVDEGCGNGELDQGELCDDGNTADGDGCSADCDSDESCGNGVEELDEQCDDGNTTGGDGCEADCTFPEPGPRCGDDNDDEGEECDDGNRTNGDGCSSDCTVEGDPSDRGCACNGGEGGASNLLVLGLAGLAIFGTRRPSTRRRKRLAQDERAKRAA